MIAAIVIIFLLTGGCININTRLQPEDPSVKEVLRGTDCVSPCFLVSVSEQQQSKMHSLRGSASGMHAPPIILLRKFVALNRRSRWHSSSVPVVSK